MAIDWSDAIRRAQAEAPFLAHGLDRQPELAQLLAAGEGAAALEWARAAGAAPDDDLGALGVALRRERLAFATALAIGDLAGAFPLTQVVGELSRLADRALDRAITAAIRNRVEGGDVRGMIALALGKHGAMELNYSSDIDPILLYDPEMLPRRARDEPGEAAQRYARELVKLLSENTGEGYVFRVDLRLRPASEVSPLAIPVEAALTHYESMALTWERAAFIRSRAAAGDIAAGEVFLAAIQPFIWRSSLDFGAIEEIRRLTQRIRANHSGPRVPGPGFNLKHGRGGIREIEFFAQTHQLIHGGRDPSLRLRGTRAALDALAEAGRISADEAQMLGDSYDRLRVLEHRLQMVNDRQTHALPDGAALDGVARLDGLADGAALVAELTHITERVARCYDTLIAEQDGTTQVDVRPAPLAERLTQLGFAEPDRVAERIAGWRDGRYRALRSAAALAAFDKMLPGLLEALAQVDEPERALLRWEGVLAGASSAINLFRLLEARPALLDQLVAVLTLAPTLAEELGRRPELLDTLVDQSALDLPGSVEELAARMQAGVQGDDYERLLDRIRIVTGEVRFALGLQLVEAVHDPMDIAAALSRTAEAALAVAQEGTAREFSRKHGVIEGGELVVLGLGRLGGGALTHVSDLDLIYLFTGDSGRESDGTRPLGGTLYFNRLAQRLSAALSVPTAQGALYEIDTRLRPQGTQGPLASTVESFGKYQREAAWTWEHMALTRARVLVGSAAAREALNVIVNEVLRQDRDEGILRADLLKMRDEMARHKSAGGPLDAKLLRGGLVDLEFLIHFLQLRDHVALTPDLRAAVDQLVAADLMPPAMRGAHDLLARLLVSARLLAPDLQQPANLAARALARACRTESYDALLREFAGAREVVAQGWQEVFGCKLEIDE